MKFYIASFVGERERTQRVQAELRQRGHEITIDWTSFPGVPSLERNDRPDEVRAIAVRDLVGQVAELAGRQLLVRVDVSPPVGAGLVDLLDSVIADCCARLP